MGHSQTRNRMEINRKTIVKQCFNDVANAFGMPEHWLGSRQRHFVDVRACIYNYLRNDRRFTLEEIATAAGLTHATIINGLKNYYSFKTLPEFVELDSSVRAILLGEKRLTYTELHTKVLSLEEKINELETALNECNRIAGSKKSK